MTNKERAELMAEGFTHKYPVGTTMRYQPVKGIEVFETVILDSIAWVLGSDDVLVRFKGRSGGFCIDHISSPE